MIRRFLAAAATVLAGCATVPGAAQVADIRIDGTRVHPESITSDAAGNIYTGSVPGTIYRATAGSTTAEPWIAREIADRLAAQGDTSGGRIFALQPDAAALELFAADPTLVGIDGIAFSAAGTMYINNVRQNSMQRVNRNGSAFASLTTLTLSEPISGPDGLRHVGGDRFLQAEGSGNRVTYVDIDGDSAMITPVKTGLESSPGVTRVGQVGYATEGKINYLFDPNLRGQDPGAFTIRAFPLP